jgi:hypothetical protein
MKVLTDAYCQVIEFLLKNRYPADVIEHRNLNNPKIHAQMNVTPT